jgi:hypothetical protein
MKKPKSKKPKSIVRAETEGGQRAGKALVEAVENQIREGQPAETKLTLERLMALGETRGNAIRYIACVLASEMFEMFQQQEPFNEARYIRNLQALPKLPGDAE